MKYSPEKKAQELLEKYDWEGAEEYATKRADKVKTFERANYWIQVMDQINKQVMWGA